MRLTRHQKARRLRNINSYGNNARLETLKSLTTTHGIIRKYYTTIFVPKIYIHIVIEN